MIKIKTKISYRFGLIFVLGLLISSGFGQYTDATTKTAAKSTSSTSSQNITQAVTQSYNADSSVDLGMLVEIKPGVANTVEALSQADAKNMLGVAVEPNQATITLTPENVNHQQIFVATTGRYDVLVSNQNGSIKSGDLITISSLSGIGMKADQNESEVLGKSAATFDGTSNVIGTANITNSLGKSSQISIGKVAVNLDIAHNPLESKETDYIPSFLSKAATTVSNKPVSAARIYLGLAVIIVASFLAGNVLYSGIRSGMIAVGRNPLTKKSIMKSLVQTVMAGLIVFVVGIFGVYLLLKL
jgi:hypothetical protein